ncbi:AEC family transporter [Anaerotalea alkaliphila]|uniref:AEC family transporter n=1 Tax=Anaerotalea alkaliphila TaxID=2662126 RepID=A0A7X5HWN2_9FIRM|nr:AEC family transporter [Anaerotalea alkaliphila]NDL68023.1 AEC family transporter [Anaerotalea alkaliphila]
MNALTTQILALALMIGVGFYGRKREIIGEEMMGGITKLLVEIAVPLLIVTSFSMDDGNALEGVLGKAFLYALLVFATKPLLAKLLLKGMEKGKGGVWQFSLVFSNCGFMGFPVAYSVYGNEGIIFASIFNMVYNIFVWSYGVALFSGERDVKGFAKVLRSPGIIASVLGIVLMLLGVRIPEVLLVSMKTIGNTTTPLSMLLIGGLLADANLRGAVRDRSVYFGSVLKLLVLPFLWYVVFLLLGDLSVMVRTYLLMIAMPAGAMTSILAEEYKTEKEYSAVVVSMSTLFSIATVPLLLRFVLV